MERRDAALIRDAAPTLYVYRLRMGEHEQTGLAGSFSVDDYETDVIKKHERTRRDKEDDRTRHIVSLRAQTGPVFLTYRRSDEILGLQAKVTAAAPLYDFEAADGVRHSVWAVDPQSCAALVAAFGRVETLYIADGHHRAASAARARADAAGRRRSGRRDSEGPTDFLAVAFPHDQVQVLPYNRIVKDLAGHTPESFLDAVGEHFTVVSRTGDARPGAARSRCTSIAGGTRFGRGSRRPRTIPSGRST